ncbi:2Fe-2S iron-sulfur cluster-binding family protein [Lyticum sinuosum]|nr:hypothetical protein [Lyticum sinuosum]
MLPIIDRNNHMEGACGGTLVYSTYHVIVDEKFYNKQDHYNIKKYKIN